MSLYENIKDVAAIVQKADNIELYRQLLDLGAQALELQDEIRQLRMENDSLLREKNMDDKIIRHKNEKADGETHPDYPYITIKGENPEIRYCAVCWGKNKKLIQLYDNLNCVVCHQNNK